MKSILHPAFLQEGPLKLVFFGGKGGVGKSTCAAALTLAQEQSQHLIFIGFYRPRSFFE
jgi:arsenite-transporting ATPase